MQTETKQKLSQRLKIIKGQVRGLQKMVDAEEYCPDILTQSIAIQESLKSFNAAMLEHHLRTHVAHQMRSHGTEQAVEELLRVYKLNGK